MEENITRLGVVVVLKGKLKDRTIPLISALFFGTVHYWGKPGGFIGVIVAGFLGWFPTESILETQGIFWAWIIHFFTRRNIFFGIPYNKIKSIRTEKMNNDLLTVYVCQ